MRRIEAKVPSPELADGIAVHEALETNVVSGLTPRQLRFYTRLDRLRRFYKPVPSFEPESYQRFQWRDWEIRRKLDDAGQLPDTHEIALLDFKTATWEWKQKEGLTPKALGPQGTFYLLTPPKEQMLGLSEWPERLDFLVAPENAATQIETYHRNPDDEANLNDMIEQVATARKFPKAQGYGCHYCDFFQACYQTEGWAHRYRKRKPSSREPEVE